MNLFLSFEQWSYDNLKGKNVISKNTDRCLFSPPVAFLSSDKQETSYRTMAKMAVQKPEKILQPCKKLEQFHIFMEVIVMFILYIHI